MTYASVEFNARYAERQANLDTTQGPGVTLAVARKDMMHLGGGVTLGGTFFSFEALRVESTQETSSYYEYNFPAGGTWHMDYLGPDSSYARAFCQAVDGVTCA